VLSSGRADGNPFASTGTFYFAPNPSFQGYLRVTYHDALISRQTIIHAIPAISGDFSVSRSDFDLISFDTNDVVNAAQLQQRLNYLGFTDVNGAALDVDGILGDRTGFALKRFKAAISNSGANDPAQFSSTLDDVTLRWLNSPAAPHWQTYAGSIPIDPKATVTEVFATNWLIDSLNSALVTVPNSHATLIALSSQNQKSSHSQGGNAGNQNGLTAFLEVDSAESRRHRSPPG
jgi:hypothetical protein